MEERITFLGSASSSGSIPSSCLIYDRVQGSELYRTMIDCGSEAIREDQNQADSQNQNPFPDISILGDKQIDAVIETHAHGDHISALPYFERQGVLSPSAKIYSSPQTAKVMPYVLQDAMKHCSGRFDAFDVANVLGRREVIPQPGEMELQPGFKIFTYQTGHLPGALGLVIETSSGRKGWIMGDRCREDLPFVKGELLPSESWPLYWRHVDEIWVTDLTPSPYDGEKTSLKTEVARMVSQTESHFTSGNITTEIFGAFGLGRGSSVAYWLSRSKLLRPLGVRIYIDGSIRDYHEVLRNNRWTESDGKLPKLGNQSGIYPIESTDHREELILSSELKIVVTTGGMGDFGPILPWMEAHLENEGSAVNFTSYLAPGTNGERLYRRAQIAKGKPFNFLLKQKSKSGVRVMQLNVKAKIDCYRTGGHSGFGYILSSVKDVIGCKEGAIFDRIILTHGASHSKLTAARELRPFTRSILYGERGTFLSV